MGFLPVILMGAYRCKQAKQANYLGESFGWSGCVQAASSFRSDEDAIGR